MVNNVNRVFLCNYNCISMNKTRIFFTKSPVFKSYEINFLCQYTHSDEYQKGIIAHVLGDSYAHTRLDDENKCYENSHLPDGTKPDCVELRPALLEDYITSLLTGLGHKPADVHGLDWLFEDFRNPENTALDDIKEFVKLQRRRRGLKPSDDTFFSQLTPPTFPNDLGFNAIYGKLKKCVK